MVNQSAPSTLAFAEGGAPMRSSFFQRIHMNRVSQPTSAENDEETTTGRQEGKSDRSNPKIGRLQKLMAAQQRLQGPETSPKSAVLPPGLERPASSIQVQKKGRLASSKGIRPSKMMPDLLKSYPTERPARIQSGGWNSVNQLVELARDPVLESAGGSKRKDQAAPQRDARSVSNSNHFLEVVHLGERHVNLRESAQNKQRGTLLKAIQN